ncbi:MAG: hypothetical protein ACP5MZ_04635, partial [Candidatus Micrarchaeia archaeon]
HMSFSNLKIIASSTNLIASIIATADAIIIVLRMPTLKSSKSVAQGRNAPKRNHARPALCLESNKIIACK